MAIFIYLSCCFLGSALFIIGGAQPLSRPGRALGFFLGGAAVLILPLVLLTTLGVWGIE